MRQAVDPKLRPAWTAWLSQRPWDLYLTLTEDGRSHPEKLHKRWLYCRTQISTSLYGRAQTRRRNPIEYVAGIERHKSWNPHSHILIRTPDVDLADQEQFSLAHWQKFISATGGWCWLERPSSSADVTAYVTKYVTKDGELILSENLSPSFDPNPPLGLSRGSTAPSARFRA